MTIRLTYNGINQELQSVELDFPAIDPGRFNYEPLNANIIYVLALATLMAKTIAP